MHVSPRTISPVISHQPQRRYTGIDAAKANGTWNSLDAIEALETPPDLEQALASYPSAGQYWDAFPRSAKRDILEWISNAKTAETRAKRIEGTARLANENVRANQWRK